MQHHPGRLTASLALQLAHDAKGLPTGYNVQLFPEGQFAASDGRPGNMQGCAAKVWLMDATIAPDIIADADAREARPVVDYEHQSIRARENGQPAPAAGWIQALAYFPGQGLFAKVEWTERARELIKSGEYRYISPLFNFDENTGAVRRLVSAALTNTPALDGLMAVAASRNVAGEYSAAAVVDSAIANGTLPKALRSWAVELGAKYPQKLTAFLGKLQPSPSLAIGGRGQAALTADEKEVARLLGMTETDYGAAKRRVALADASFQVAALTAADKEVARLLGMTETEFLAAKEAE